MRLREVPIRILYESLELRMHIVFSRTQSRGVQTKDEKLARIIRSAW